jgi:hypothetical protein
VRTNNPFFNGAFNGYCKAYGSINSSNAGEGQPTNATTNRSPAEMEEEDDPLARSPSTDRTFGVGAVHM